MKGSAAQRKEVDTGDCWNGFRAGDWTTSINVRDFIVRNVTPYTGSEDFLVAPSQRTKAVWAKLQPYFADERKKGVLAVDAAAPSTLLAHKPGYIDRENEVIVGLQTDQPFKRAIFPFGGLRMVEAGLKAAGFDPDPAVHEAFTKYRKSHNDGVFDAYTPEIMNCRRSESLPAFRMPTGEAVSSATHDLDVFVYRAPPGSSTFTLVLTSGGPDSNEVTNSTSAGSLTAGALTMTRSSGEHNGGDDDRRYNPLDGTTDRPEESGRQTPAPLSSPRSRLRRRARTPVSEARGRARASAGSAGTLRDGLRERRLIDLLRARRHGRLRPRLDAAGLCRRWTHLRVHDADCEGTVRFPEAGGSSSFARHAFDEVVSFGAA